MKNRRSPSRICRYGTLGENVVCRGVKRKHMKTLKFPGGNSMTCNVHWRWTRFRANKPI